MKIRKAHNGRGSVWHWLTVNRTPGVLIVALPGLRAPTEVAKDRGYYAAGGYA